MPAPMHPREIARLRGIVLLALRPKTCSVLSSAVARLAIRRPPDDTFCGSSLQVDRQQRRRKRPSKRLRLERPVWGGEIEPAYFRFGSKAEFNQQTHRASASRRT